MYKGYIYSIKNILNNKQYIGQTIHLKKRIVQHFSNAKNMSNTSPLYNSIRKNKKDNFKVKVLEEIKCDLQEDLWKRLNETEKYYIKKYNSVKNGYNLTEGGEGIKGYKYTIEHRQKISKHFKNLWKKGICKKHTPWNKGIKLKDNQKNMNQDKKFLFKGKNNPFYNKKHTKNSKDKISMSRRNKLKGKENPAARKVKNLDTGKIFDTIREAGIFYNIKSSFNISSVCNKKLKTCGGFHWKYI